MVNASMNSRLDLLRERWSDPLLTTLTVLLILMMFVFAPLQAVGIKLFQVLSFLSALGLIAGIFLLSGSPTVVVALLSAFGMAGTAAWSRLNAPSVLDVYLLAGALLIMGVAMVGVVARTVFAAGRVTHHRITGAILVYLSVALIFTSLFTIVGLLVPNAFSGMSFEDNPALASKVIYFSFVTLTSTGYGDVYPIHPVARSLCNFETIIGQLYPATLLARLVTLEIEGRRLFGLLSLVSLRGGNSTQPSPCFHTKYWLRLHRPINIPVWHLGSASRHIRRQRPQPGQRASRQVMSTPQRPCCT